MYFDPASSFYSDKPNEPPKFSKIAPPIYEKIGHVEKLNTTDENIKYSCSKRVFACTIIAIASCIGIFLILASYNVIPLGLNAFSSHSLVFQAIGGVLIASAPAALILLCISYLRKKNEKSEEEPLSSPKKVKKNQPVDVKLDPVTIGSNLKPNEAFISFDFVAKTFTYYTSSGAQKLGPYRTADDNALRKLAKNYTKELQNRERNIVEKEDLNDRIQGILRIPVDS